MAEVLLDSDILIDHLRGYEPARQYLKRVLCRNSLPALP